ncbi:hypothetical protein HDE_01684 [Halotydeus destructor]|nr:hypothetical protein HDE_01684 [Halotydeus destructor]
MEGPKRRGRKPLVAKKQLAEDVDPVPEPRKTKKVTAKMAAAENVDQVCVHETPVEQILTEEEHYAKLPKGFLVDLDKIQLAHFEVLDPRKQRFYFEDREIYCRGTEFSFEENRGRKWKEQKERENERKRTLKLEDEVQLLRQQVAMLLEMKQTQISGPQIVERVTSATNTTRPMISKEKSSNKETFSALLNATAAESDQVDGMSPIREPVTEPVLLVAKPPAFAIFVDETTKVTHGIDVVPKTKIDFDIYTDPTKELPVELAEVKNISQVAKKIDIPEQLELPKSEDEQNMDESESENFPTDFSVAPGFMGREALTFVMPNSETEFIDCAVASTSTPAAPRATRQINRIKKPEQTAGPDDAHFKLSPIVETSREYKSSSSSSACSTAHTTRAMNKLRKWRMSREQENLSRKTLRDSSQE